MNACTCCECVDNYEFPWYIWIVNTSLHFGKTCSFIGHRDTEITYALEIKIQNTIEDLIKNHNVLNFLLGSKSNFNTLCHKVVSKLREKYPNIKRVAYTCKSEACILESDLKKWEEIYSQMFKDKVQIFGVEEEYHFKSKYLAGKSSYIERNYAMIDDSDFCVFFYDEKQINKHSKGTSLAFSYAKRRKKDIINLCE